MSHYVELDIDVNFQIKEKKIYVPIPFFTPEAIAMYGPQ